MKMKDYGFYRGVDLGGWFSQCDYSEDRMDHFITEKDFSIIAGWGLDHVRIPVDYNVMENDDGTWKTDGFRRIENALKCAEKNGLKVVLDLHKTAGFSFDAGEKEEGFFFSEACQQRFYRLWEEMANQHADPKHVALELLNEVTDESFISAWNRISRECIRRIRAITPDSLILLGSYHNNAPDALKDLDAPADSRVIFNFHCYDPLPFTHQGAYWVPGMDLNCRFSISEPLSAMKEAQEKSTWPRKPDEFDGLRMDRPLDASYFKKRMAKAVRIAQERNVRLYCGEYGVINLAEPEDTVLWYRAIHEAFEEYGIGRAAWSYKEMDFGLVDDHLKSVLPEIIKLL